MFTFVPLRRTFTAASAGKPQISVGQQKSDSQLPFQDYHTSWAQPIGQECEAFSLHNFTKKRRKMKTLYMCHVFLK
jgi:hypothetical protein